MEEVNFYGSLISVRVTWDRIIGTTEYGIIKHNGRNWRVAKRINAPGPWEVCYVLQLK